VDAPHLKRLNFPDPADDAALLPPSSVGAQGSTAAHGAAGGFVGKSGFFGVSKNRKRCYKSTPWQAEVGVPYMTDARRQYVVGQFATKVGRCRLSPG
jgi:hypothetical protein